MKLKLKLQWPLTKEEALVVNKEELIEEELNKNKKTLDDKDKALNKKDKVSGKKDNLANLETVIIEHRLEGDDLKCKECGNELTEIDKEVQGKPFKETRVREQMEIENARSDFSVLFMLQKVVYVTLKINRGLD